MCRNWPERCSNYDSIRHAKPFMKQLFAFKKNSNKKDYFTGVYCSEIMSLQRLMRVNPSLEADRHVRSENSHFLPQPVLTPLLPSSLHLPHSTALRFVVPHLLLPLLLTLYPLLLGLRRPTALTAPLGPCGSRWASYRGPSRGRSPSLR